MSCAVGIQIKDRTYIGVDSCASDEEEITIREDEKIFKVGKGRMLIAGVGGIRTFQIIRFSFKPPIQKDKDDFQYLCKDFAYELKECLRENNELTNEEDTNLETMACNLLIAYKGKLYMVGEDFQIEKTMSHFNAIGSGASYSLGSLYTTEKSRLSPKQRILLALKSSAKFANTVEPPFKILSIGR